MRVLLIHNYYQQRGGEDAVFETERDLLRAHGNEVETLIFENNTIQSWQEKLKTGFHLFYNATSAKVLQQKIQRFQPDVIHVHNFFPIASPALFIQAKRLGIPIVLTLHNYRLICANALLYRQGSICEKCIPQHFPLAGIQHRCYRQSALQTALLTGMNMSHRFLKTWQNAVDRYIVLTQFSKQKFISSQLNLAETKIMVKPNCLEDPGIGEPKNRKDYFLFVGRLSEEKGVSLLLKTFQSNHKMLKIIGSGPLETLVKEATENNPNIEYLGFQQKEVILETLKQARALIFPSIWYEGFPVTLLEALSTGTPVLVSKIGGLPEIIQDGFNGLHFSAGSEQSLSEKIDLISRDDTLHQSLCLNARESYLSFYTPKHNYETLIEVYRQAIQAHHANPKNCKI